MKNGFTLAEVLITLGIIGVVAALTIPTLISNYKKHVYYTQFRKGANIIENAFLLFESAVNDESCDMDEYKSGGCFIKALPNYVKGHLSDGENELKKANYKALNAEEIDFSEGYCGKEYCPFFTMINGFVTWYQAEDETIYIDTNGTSKGPNVYGRDLFSFSIQNEPILKLYWDGSKGSSEYFGINGNYWKESTDCSSAGFGTFCAGRLIEEGKMNY